MQFITLHHETDFAGWRQAARTLVLNEVQPSNITWAVHDDTPELFGQTTTAPLATAERTFAVSARFVDLAKSAILHRNRERFAMLYRLLWRVYRQPDLLTVAIDPDVSNIAAMAKAVHRDQHKMKAFVRFREIEHEQDSRFVAWFEPEHHIVEATASFFATRFADMVWSILTPDVCVHWDRTALSYTTGGSKTDAPSEDRLEETWLRYYASIFNPARLKVKAMQTEMPKKYWRNLPEASLIKPLIADASRLAGAMIAGAPTQPHKSQKRPEPTMTSKPASTTDSISTLRAEAENCRACPLWKDATQTIFGEGPHTARVMLVGEQPGDKEDLSGQPFVGPAGQMLNRALDEAGVDRNDVYVTNAVKHFKFLPRGKFRLHQKPNTAEIKACRPWYERELAAINPELVVAMGATAAQSVLGKVTPINKNRGHLINLDDNTRALVTVHPSYLLRLPDEKAKALEYQRFVDDLRIVAGLLRKSAHAA
jgi:uracil-DNA glycosylase